MYMYISVCKVIFKQILRIIRLYLQFVIRFFCDTKVYKLPLSNELFLNVQGNNYSHLEKEIGSDQLPANEHYFGLVNVSSFFLNTFCRFEVNYEHCTVPIVKISNRIHIYLKQSIFSLQFGNTCYCNSVLQALYFCRPFRERVLQFKQLQKNNKKESLLTCLADLFYSIASQKKKVGTIAPKKFITRLRKEYGMCASQS